MHHISLNIPKTKSLHHTLAEKDEPVGVVFIIALTVSIRRAPVEKLLATNQMDQKVFPGGKHPNVSRKKLVSHFDLEPKLPLCGRRVRVLQRHAISRQKHGD